MSEINKTIIEKNLKTAQELGTDIVEASYFCGCCKECAKYRGRWFSISGADTRFPKMPQDYNCQCSGLDFSPVIYGLSIPVYCPDNTDIIAYSNRPFTDDRTDEEKRTFDYFQKEETVRQFYAPYKERWDNIRKYDHDQYDKLCEVLPHLAPKSFSAFMRMKKNNTENYKKIAAEAAAKNILLDYTDELKKEIEFLTPIREKYSRMLAALNELKSKL